MTNIAPNTEIHIIDNFESFKDLQNYVNNNSFQCLTLDVETNSAIEKIAKLWGISLLFQLDEAFYIVWRDKLGNEIFNQNQQQIIANWIKEQSQLKKLIMHNGIYDILVLENNLNINLEQDLYHDTILSKHLIDEERPFGLKEIAVKYLGPWADKAQEELYNNIEANGGSTKKDNVEMFKADTNILANYAGFDVILTYRLFELFEEELKKQELDKLYYIEEVMPLYKNVVINMKRKGFPIDVEYFKQLKVELETEINNLEESIINEVKEEVAQFEQDLLDEKHPIKSTGNFPKVAAELFNYPLPINSKTGEITLAKKAVQLQRNQVVANSKDYKFYSWLLNETSNPLSSTETRKVQEKLYFNDNEGKKYVFNLKSKDHLIYLLIEKKKYKPLGKTDGGKPQMDEEFIESLKGKEVFIDKLIDFNKLNKLLGTYVEGILDRQIDGIIYTSMLQFGTTSGRFSSTNPNLQNIPRIKDEDSGLSELVLNYVNAIKKGFIAPKGYKIVNADYSQLEVMCFTHMSNSEALRQAVNKGEDIYSKVAIDVNKLTQYSADKKAVNYLKKCKPELRQNWKEPVLGIVYGMQEAKLCEVLGCEYNEATRIINSYLDTYPDLKKYMNKCDYEAKKYGRIRTAFGRVRHLPEAKRIYELYGNNVLDYKWAKQRGLTQVRREFKNSLNNAKNVGIQGLAAHIVNRAMIKIQSKFKENKIEGYVSLQIHDEILSLVREDQVKLADKIVKDCMENTTKISVQLKADPIIANNWADSK